MTYKEIYDKRKSNQAKYTERTKMEVGTAVSFLHKGEEQRGVILEFAFQAVDVSGILVGFHKGLFFDRKLIMVGLFNVHKVKVVE